MESLLTLLIIAKMQSVKLIFDILFLYFALFVKFLFKKCLPKENQCQKILKID